MAALLAAGLSLWTTTKHTFSRATIVLLLNMGLATFRLLLLPSAMFFSAPFEQCLWYSLLSIIVVTALQSVVSSARDHGSPYNFFYCLSAVAIIRLGLSQTSLHNFMLHPVLATLVPHGYAYTRPHRARDKTRTCVPALAIKLPCSACAKPSGPLLFETPWHATRDRAQTSANYQALTRRTALLSCGQPAGTAGSATSMNIQSTASVQPAAAKLATPDPSVWLMHCSSAVRSSKPQSNRCYPAAGAMTLLPGAPLAYCSSLAHTTVSVKVLERPTYAGVSGTASASHEQESRSVQHAVTRALRSTLAMAGAGAQIVRTCSYRGCIRVVMQAMGAPRTRMPAVIVSHLRQRTSASLGPGFDVTEIHLADTSAADELEGMVGVVDSPAWEKQVLPNPVVLCTHSIVTDGAAARHEAGEAEGVPPRAAPVLVPVPLLDLQVHLPRALCEAMAAASSGLRAVASEVPGVVPVAECCWSAEEIAQLLQAAGPDQQHLTLRLPGWRPEAARHPPLHMLLVSLLQVLPPLVHDKEGISKPAENPGLEGGGSGAGGVGPILAGEAGVTGGTGHLDERFIALLEVPIAQDPAVALELSDTYAKMVRGLAGDCALAYHQHFTPLAKDLALAASTQTVNALVAAVGLSRCASFAMRLLKLVVVGRLLHCYALLSSGVGQVPELVRQMWELARNDRDHLM